MSSANKFFICSLIAIAVSAAFGSLCFCQVYGEAGAEPKVLPGIEVLLKERSAELAGKRIGLITNPTGVDHRLVSTIDLLFAQPQLRLTALFGPEHGVRGNRPAGAAIDSYVDEKTGLPVFSLYGKTKKPTPDMLRNVDVLLFDIQDVGVRPYTYIYTMAYAMQAAAEAGIPFIVLDRPNPLGGLRVEGPVLQPEFSSFIGLYPIAYVHGMTVGELARFFNQEFNIHADLRVIPMKGWRRDMTFADTGLPWVPTSPHVPHWFTPFFQATVGAIGELSSVNIGIGYTAPFQMVGAGWIDGDRLSRILNQLDLPGVLFRPLVYTPFYGGRAGKDLQGVQIHITDLKKFRPVRTQIALLYALYHLNAQDSLFVGDLRMFRFAMGTDKLDRAIVKGNDLQSVLALANEGLADFIAKRSRYLIY
ncbi:MAG: DUF1343 domain-containing protein [candidate division KSB1 bacterium]|nr:DUF1343 domain-containing protein [candidate division KSB1 bacterium]